MKIKTDQLKYNVSVVLLGALAVLFTCVLVTSIGKNLIDMMVRVGMAWRHPGNYVGLFAGFVGYGMFLCTLVIPRVRRNIP